MINEMRCREINFPVYLLICAFTRIISIVCRYQQTFGFYANQSLLYHTDIAFIIKNELKDKYYEEDDKIIQRLFEPCGII